MTWIAVVFGLVIGALTLINFVVGLFTEGDVASKWNVLQWGLGSEWVLGLTNDFYPGSVALSLAVTVSLFCVGVFSLLTLLVSGPFSADRPRWPILGSAAASLAYLVTVISYLNQWNFSSQTVRRVFVPITYVADSAEREGWPYGEALFYGPPLLGQFVAVTMVLWVIVGGLWLARRRLPQPEGASALVTTGEGTGDMDSIAAGWYADPDGKPADRYWDGEDWTDKTRPATHSYGSPVVRNVQAPADRTNVLAIVALVSAFVVPLILPLILGYVSLGQIRRTGEQGKGLAIASIVLGWIFLAFFVLFIGLAITAANEASTYR